MILFVAEFLMCSYLETFDKNFNILFCQILETTDIDVRLFENFIFANNIQFLFFIFVFLYLSSKICLDEYHLCLSQCKLKMSHKSKFLQPNHISFHELVKYRFHHRTMQLSRLTSFAVCMK